MKRFGHRLWLAVLGSLLMLGVGGKGAAETVLNPRPGTGASTQAHGALSNPTICIEPSSTPGGGTLGSRRNPANIGQTIPVTGSVGGANNRFDVTITEVVTGQEALNRLRQANEINEAPPAGKEYVLFRASAHITKTNGEQTVFLTEYDWSLVDSTGRVYSPSEVVEPEPEFTGTGFEGATIDGWVTVPRKVGEQVSLVFGLEMPQGLGGGWFTAPGQ